MNPLPFCRRPRKIPDLSLAAHSKELWPGNVRLQCGRCGVEALLSPAGPGEVGRRCYRCWVKGHLEYHGWEPWTKHPDWCTCEIGH